MSVTDVHKDLATLTLTITADFDAPVDRVWRIWSDPRQLERWWGPPAYPATVVDHDLRPGGRVTYYMTGPEGDQPRGWWQVVAVDPPHALEFDDGFADDAGQPNPDLPTMRVRVALTERGGGTRMTIASTFGSAAEMEQVLAMGAEEGMKEALSQVDALLAVPA